MPQGDTDALTRDAMPRVTIVTLSYNQAQFLAEAMDSVLSQDIDDLEYIVVDPGSTDGSAAIIKARRQRLALLVEGSDRSPSHGLARGFAAATGDIYGFLNSDDRLRPGALAAVVQAFADDPSLDIVSGHMRIIDASGRTRRLSFTDRFSRWGMALGTWNICQQSTFFRADAFHNAGGFDPDVRVSWDYDLMVRMFLCRPKHRIINRLLSDFRVYDQSITGAKRFQEQRDAMFYRHFEHITGRRWRPIYRLARLWQLMMKYAREPRALAERLRRGSLYAAVRARRVRFGRDGAAAQRS